MKTNLTNLTKVVCSLALLGAAATVTAKPPGNSFSVVSDGTDGTVNSSYVPPINMPPFGIMQGQSQQWFNGVASTFTGSFITDQTLKVSFSAPAGFEFAVNPPPGASANFTYDSSSSAGDQLSGATLDSFSFIGGTGDIPTSLTGGGDINIGDGFTVYAEGTIDQPMTFTGFTADFTMPSGDVNTYDGVSQQTDILFRANVNSDPGIWVTVQAIPEPSTLALLAVGALGLLFRRQHRV
jgi:hypothetical protein